MVCISVRIRCKNLLTIIYIGTLEYLIIVQDVINVQAGKFPKKNNNRTGCNKRAGWKIPKN